MNFIFVSCFLPAIPPITSCLINGHVEVGTERDMLRLKAFSATLSEAEKAGVLRVLEDRGFQPPARAELASELGMQGAQMDDMLKLMHKEGSAVRINDAMYLSAPVYKKMIALLGGFFKNKGEMTVSEFRDLLGTTRKYAVPLLEYLDSNNITLRTGDVRKFLLK